MPGVAHGSPLRASGDHVYVRIPERFSRQDHERRRRQYQQVQEREEKEEMNYLHKAVDANFLQ